MLHAKEVSGFSFRKQSEVGRPPSRHCTVLLCTPPPQLAVHCKSHTQQSQAARMSAQFNHWCAHSSEGRSTCTRVEIPEVRWWLATMQTRQLHLTLPPACTGVYVQPPPRAPQTSPCGGYSVTWLPSPFLRIKRSFVCWDSLRRGCNAAAFTKVSWHRMSQHWNHQ